MTAYIGQASCDERGKYVGGQAGNQTGTELNTRAAYLYSWHALIRFNDPGMATKCGQAMADAVANMRIGYDQGERNSILLLACAVIAGRYGVGDARRAALGDKYAAVQARVNELLSGTANAAGTSTGTARIIAGEYKVVCSKLYVRSTPSRKLQPVADYSNGQRIYSVAADVVEAEGYVWAHYTAYSGATRYVAIGTADGSEKFLVKV